MEIARAVSPELIPEPGHVWQQKVKAVLEVIKGGRHSGEIGVEQACRPVK